MDGEWLEVWMPRLGVYTELLADTEFQEVGKELMKGKIKPRTCRGF
jgi:hypothetical protein